MAFNPDEYLKKTSSFNPDEYLAKTSSNEAPVGLQTADTVLSSAGDIYNEGIEAAKKDPLSNRLLEYGEDISGVLGAIPSAAASAAHGLARMIGIPEGPKPMETLLPKTSKQFNPTMLQMASQFAPILALEGLGRVGSGLKNYGQNGMVKAFEKGKPALPAGADKAMVADILEKNYLPHHEAAADVIAESALNLRKRGIGGSEAVKEITDPAGITITPQRIEELHEFIPEHPKVQELKERLDAARAGQITQDFVEEKPGYKKQEKIMSPSEAIATPPNQGDLFDQAYYANKDAYSKQVPDYQSHPGMEPAPAGPTIQKHIEPNLEGPVVKNPASYEFKETQVPPEGRYEFKPESVADIFSYANKNRSRWERHPITGEPHPKKQAFGNMMAGLRSDLRSITTPLTEEQLQKVKLFNPEFSGSTVGEAVADLHAGTHTTIKDQSQITKRNVENSPLSFMERAYSDPDKIAFAQRLGRDYDLNAIMEYSQKYGKSREYAKELAKYMKDGLKPSEFSPEKFAVHAMYGGTPAAVAYEAGQLAGSPVRRYSLANSIGGFAEKLKPSNLLKMNGE